MERGELSVDDGRGARASTRPTAWPTWASCPRCRRSSTASSATHQTMLFSATLDGAVKRLVDRYMHDPVLARGRGRRADRRGDGAPLPPRAPDGQGEGRRRRSPRASTARSCSCAPSAAPTGSCTQLEREGVQAARDPRRPPPGRARAGARRLHRRQGAGARRHRRRRTRHPRRRRRRRRALRPAEDDKAYLHRSGRTARAGESGVAVTLMLWNQENDVRVDPAPPRPARSRSSRSSPTTRASPTSPTGIRPTRSRSSA